MDGAVADGRGDEDPPPFFVSELIIAIRWLPPGLCTK